MKYVRPAVDLLIVLAAMFSSQLTRAQVGSQNSPQNETNAAKLAPPRFFYSTEYLNGKVGGYIVNPSTGELTSNGQPPVWAHWGPTRIASDSDGYRLYVANQGSQDVSAYFIYRNNGWLYPVPGANFPVGGVSTDIAVHPSDKFVYVTTATNDGGVQGNSDSVSAFSVASDGSLVSVPGSPFITDGPDWGIAIDPNGQYLYASSQVSDANQSGVINAFSIDQTTGALTAIPGSPFPIIPYNCPVCLGFENIYGMAIDRVGKFLIGGGYNNGVVYVYRIEAGTGSISEVAGSPFIELLPVCAHASCAPGDAPTDVNVSPTDKHVFATNHNGNSVGRYNFDSSTGALSNLTSTPPSAGWVTVEGVVRSDPSGKFLYSLGCTVWAGQQSKPGMIGFDIATNGSMSVVPNAPYYDPGVEACANVDGIAVTR
ncbi:MAG TPA: beta-propeller fold lactonase family protein [Candidatus Sulfotelmatobacter sp.]